MQKRVSIFLVVLLLLSCAFTTTPEVYASNKAEDSRAIAIVFDNSGSMYIKGEKAWCRATYAMEVFASMLNKGDVLQIYPMHPITVNNTEYTMNKPFTITDATQASAIRNIYTKKALGTPIESVDAAANGVKQLQATKKYMIVLTDGDSFYKNGSEMSASATKKELDARFKQLSGADMTVMYLGVGKKVVMPDTPQSQYFVKKQAKNSEDTLSALTEMCNQIFGRDTLPKSYLSAQSMKFDISMKKLIVFVQGENVSDLKVVGSSGDVGKQESIISTKYGTAGCGNYKSVPDTSLQGMMVTFSDCVAGNYNIEYKGKATDIEVYYEPDADLDFVFTDAEGNMVNLDTLYEGDYKVAFGMKDAKTDQLISSELLGKPHYEGSYFINGKEYPFSQDGQNGEVPIGLKMKDAFKAKLTVTYLSGYTITKDSADFGWPDEGIHVAARPAGDLKLTITDGDILYSLSKLEQGKPYKAEIYYQGKKLTGEELKKVELKWNPDTSYAEIKKEFADDHYNLTLHYKNEKKPADTICGKCKVAIHAFYAAPDEGIHVAARPAGDLKLTITDGDILYSLSKLEQGKPYKAEIYYQGKKLTGEELKKVELKWNPDTSYAEIKKEFADDHYNLTLHYKNEKKPADTICGKCKVAIHAFYAAPGSAESKAQATLTYKIEDDFVPIKVDLVAPDDYIVIADLEKSRPMIAKITTKGKPLSSEEFKSVTLDVDCSGIEYKITPNPEESSFSIQLLSTKDLAEADYPVKVTAKYTDHIGRASQAEDALSLTLSNTPLWVKWLLGLGILLLLIFLIWKISHIRVLPKRVRHIKGNCKMMVGTKDETSATNFTTKLSGKQLSFKTDWAGNVSGVSISDIKPEKSAFLCKPSHKRRILIEPQKIRPFGDMTEVNIDGAVFKVDPNEGTLIIPPTAQNPIKIYNGMNIRYKSNIVDSFGKLKSCNATIPITFKK